MAMGDKAVNGGGLEGNANRGSNGDQHGSKKKRSSNKGDPDRTITI